MNPRTVPAMYAQLFPWLAEQGQVPDDRIIAEFQDLCSRGMDQALGIQEKSFDTAIQWQSQALDMYKNAYWFAPSIGDLFDLTAQFLTSCMELQMKCLALMLSGTPAAGDLAIKAQPASTSAEVERNIEIATGQRKAGGSVEAQHKHRKPEPEPEEESA